jgi:hypothetical protein
VPVPNNQILRLPYRFASVVATCSVASFTSTPRRPRSQSGPWEGKELVSLAAWISALVARVDAPTSLPVANGFEGSLVPDW